MKTTAALCSVTAIITALLAVTPCQAGDAPPADIPVPDDVVVANNSFAFDLYSRLASQPGNLFFSPYSIETALAMTWDGARGQTASQMRKAMHLSGSADAVSAGFGALLKELNLAAQPVEVPRSHDNSPSVPFQLFVANSLWCQQGHPFQESFLSTAREKYEAGVNQVDFISATEAARKSINDWVAKQTQDKIENLIPPGAIDDSTRLVLANAIYFKGRWQKEFYKPATQALPFYPIGGQAISVPTMNLTREFAYSETDDQQVLELPYLFGKTSMIIILPGKPDGLPKLEKSLTAARIKQLLAKGQMREVSVFLPKFKLTSAFSLVKTLQALGVTDAFSFPVADFSGVDGTRDLFIGAVLHKAFVDVDEEGTEAAAATAVAMTMGMARPLPKPIIFRADHPFLFLIRHNQSGAILFMGRVASP